MTTPAPSSLPGSSGARTLMAFLAGAMVGAFVMVQLVPAGAVAGQAAGGGGQVLGLAPDGTVDGAVVTEDGTLVTPEGETLAVGPEGTYTIDPGTFATTGGTTGGTSTGGTTTGGSSGSSSTGGSTSGTAGGSTSGGTTSGSTTRGTTTGSSTTGGTTTGGTSTGGSGSGGVSLGGGGGSQSGASGSSQGGTNENCNSSNNGGVTDTGITADKIKVAATTVEDGPGASLLQPAKIGMQAVINKVNAGGGICGRRIELFTRNDSWDPAAGKKALNDMIRDGNFALLVVPSSEGLAEAIKAGDISRAGIPVVGTTGLRIDEYRDPWVFPVSAATLSVMRVMAKHAYDKGARTFGIVYDSKFKFGIEGKDAFVDYVSKLPGATVKGVQPLDPTASGYPTEAQKFNGECGTTSSGPGCDMVALLLVPQGAEKWKTANSGAHAGRGKVTHGAQTLFTDAFATQCGSWCNGLMVWTGYHPPLPPADTKAGVRTYKADVRNVSASVDATNQFVEGAYLGSQVFVDAVARCSPKVTRECIKSTLDSVDFQTDLASTLSWRPGSHHANKAAQAFSIEATGGSFNGWRYENTGFIRDPGL